MIPRTLLVVTLLSLCAAPLSGCDSGGDTGSESPGSAAAPGATPAAGGGNAAATAEATKLFQSRCLACHGPLGHGDGPASKGLNPQPRNLSDAAWQKSVDDAYLERVIHLGGAAVGKSPAMPPNPDLGDKPEVLEALRAKVRSLAAP